jgi:threonine/homoserine/homoserine lactone efflux protein
METTQLYALFSFALISVITPGPNNIMLMTSGANVGFKKSIPHMLGITIGFATMVFVLGLGLVNLFSQFPLLHLILHWVSIAYLIYLSYKIATSSNPSESEIDYQPMSLISAAIFQWVNPKAWSMAISAISIYNTSASLEGVVIICIAFTMANLPSVSMWTLVGTQIQKVLNSTLKLTIFNLSMAILLLASLLPML